MNKKIISNKKTQTKEATKKTRTTNFESYTVKIPFFWQDENRIRNPVG